jgi:hypothetical protein
MALGFLLINGFPVLEGAPSQPSPAMLEIRPKGDPVDIDKLPKVVVDAVQRELPGAHLTRASRLADGSYFLGDVKVKKEEYNVTVSADGKILKKEDDDD